MEVKINKDIREFHESIFFGLSMRQCIFSILACGVALLLYFLLKPFFGIETLSWVCILGAVPFAVLGFVKYNGMTAEQFIMAWIRTIILLPSHLHFKSTTYYFELFKPLSVSLPVSILEISRILLMQLSKNILMRSRKNEKFDLN